MSLPTHWLATLLVVTTMLHHLRLRVHAAPVIRPTTSLIILIVPVWLFVNAGEIVD
jgi:hypothetical protein